MIFISKERLIILTMLEQGRISCEEAIRLLETLGNTSEETSKLNPDYDTLISENLEKTLKGLNWKIDTISKSLSQKFDSIGKEIGSNEAIDTRSLSEKLKSIEDEYKEKLEVILSNISKNKDGFSSILIDKTNELQNSRGSVRFNNSLDNLQVYFKDLKLNIPDLGTKVSGILNGVNIKNDTTANAHSITYNRNLTKDEVINLVFENIYGSISIEGYDGEDIEIKTNTRSDNKNAREIFTLVNERDTYGIKAASNTDAYLSIEVSVPQKKISNLKISSSNGKITVSDINCAGITIVSHNSRIYLSGTCTKIFHGGAENSKIEFSDGKYDKIAVKSIATQVLMYNLNCNSLEIKTSKGRIMVELSEDFKGCGIMDVSTENAEIGIDLTQCIDLGTSIEAVNMEGSINISVPGIVYSSSETIKTDGTRILCETPDYSTSQNKISIKAVTSKELISIK